MRTAIRPVDRRTSTLFHRRLQHIHIHSRRIEFTQLTETILAAHGTVVMITSNIIHILE